MKPPISRRTSKSRQRTLIGLGIPLRESPLSEALPHDPARALALELEGLSVSRHIVRPNVGLGPRLPKQKR